MLGVPYAYGKEKHISIAFISNTFTEKNSLRTKIGIEILIIALSVFVMIIGGCMVASNAAGSISGSGIAAATAIGGVIRHADHWSFLRAVLCHVLYRTAAGDQQRAARRYQQ